MLTLKSPHYTKEDYEYLLRVSSVRYYCLVLRGVSVEDCGKCKHSLACKDLQDLSLHLQGKLRTKTLTDC